MASNIFHRDETPSRHDRPIQSEAGASSHSGEVANLRESHRLVEENLDHNFNYIDAETPATARRHAALDTSNNIAGGGSTQFSKFASTSRWPYHDEDVENDVPASLLVESNEQEPKRTLQSTHTHHDTTPLHAGKFDRQPKAQWQATTVHQHMHPNSQQSDISIQQPRSLMNGLAPGGRREKALWRWVNISNLDSFMRDVYDYYEGGGLLCILCSNALWLLETLFVAVLLTFLTQCVDYGKVPHSKSLSEVVVDQCTRNMSTSWSLGIWMYSFFFIWKSVQYFFEIRRLIYVRDFFVYLLEIPEQDMQTVSWQDIVARIMSLRDDNPKTATNMPRNLRRYIGSQSKERLDAHDIANRLMRKENFLIAMINKDVLNLSLPVPLLGDRQLFSKTMEWYLHYCILDMAFNEFGQVRQEFLRADRRSLLSQKLRQRLYFAGFLNLIFAPVVLAYVVIVYFFTYYNEYQKDPKLAAARKYTALAEWKFREFNELPHIFYERLHMSFPFATRYIEQFPKRMTEEIARSISFMSGAITAVLAVGTLLDSELFLGFEITQDRPVLFYLGVFGAIWAMTRGMISEETTVFNPEYALRNVIEYTHYMPDHWQGRLHSFEVKQEFSELYKMKVVIFLEEVLGIITTPMLLFFSLPKCAEQVVDFFREFTIHVDGLGYVCSFAVFDFKKGMRQTQTQAAGPDLRDDYYSTKHGKMAASYYGFLDNYVINPKTGIPGHMPPGPRGQFYPPPAFPSLNSPSLAADMHKSHISRTDLARNRARGTSAMPHKRAMVPTVPQLSPMASVLLDPHNQPTAPSLGARSWHRTRQARGAYHGENQIVEEGAGYGADRQSVDDEDDVYDEGGILGESTWETSPDKGLSRENSSTQHGELGEGGVLGLIYQLRQAQHRRRGGVV
ncbi:ATG9 domain protein [Metarhizium robertsii]|uniref:Autophagy-related protein 9 n=2 Tax=Metarhizium robertsii TaxID=568076 RepID=E9EWT5_METRA|nr:Autophagy-related protein 9 [Metarhizium robertsii ARSEF 23]EFY99555.2 Autophagy-related protein 9 [Metarhizium robertsii ARSEF 23]EXV06229.1 ATG9 domain protein [Metarhizium robertsii]